MRTQLHYNNITINKRFRKGVESLKNYPCTDGDRVYKLLLSHPKLGKLNRKPEPQNRLKRNTIHYIQIPSHKYAL